MIKKYAKVVTSGYSLCAIYEPHPFRSSAISEAVDSHINTGVTDDNWIWVYYDWCGNPIGLSDEKPEGVEVDKFTTDNLKCAQMMVDYLNREYYGEEE